MWKRLTHPNVLPLVGVTTTPSQLILDWMPGGQRLEYIGNNPDADRLGLVGGLLVVLTSFSLLPLAIRRRQGPLLPPLLQCDSWKPQGGTWLFQTPLPRHTNTNQPNVFVDHSGRARIADFGLATVTQNVDSVRNASLQRGFTPRWAAPEVLNEGPHSKEADIFSFAMVTIEVRHG